MRTPRPIAAVTVLLALTFGVESAQAAFPVAQNGRIVFERVVNGRTHVFAMNADGTNPVDLSPADTKGDFDPQFSPDGRWIVFGRGLEPEGTFHTFVMRADGTGAVDLTPGLQGALGPTFSPDGQRIAFVMDTNPDLSAGFYTLAIMKADGSGVSDLTPGDSSFELRPDFSTDGSRIVFDRDESSGVVLWAINPDGSGAARLTPPGNASDRSGAFSPTGTGLAWARDPDVLDSSFGSDIYVGDTALGDATNVTPTGAHQYKQDPSFSPDGSKIVFTSYEGMGKTELFMVGAGGGPVGQVTPTGQSDSRAHWEYVYRCKKRHATIVGDDGAEVIKGTKKADVIVGNGGNDRIKGKGGNDRICGGRGNDRLIGGKGRKDRLVGGPGKDKVKQ